MADLYTRFDGVFFEKTRLSIMTLLNQDEELTFTVLKERLGASDGALYTHIEKLIGAGYIAKGRHLTVSGTQTRYELTALGRATYAEYIDFLSTILSESSTEAQKP